jgi:hypothetical protein
MTTTADLMTVTREMVARTLFVTAWADWTDQYGKGTPGMGAELMDVAPKTPVYAYEAADKLIKDYEEICRCSWTDLFARAFLAEHVEKEEATDIVKLAREFGYCLTMEALGHGVSWEDSHAKFYRGHVYFEFTYFDLDEKIYPIPKEKTE